jgi:hypothetical protein
MKRLITICLVYLSISSFGVSQAAIISHVPNDGVPPVVKTPAFNPLVPGGEVGTAFIGFGVDYTYGNVEGIFDNGGGDEGAFAGINGAGVLDLVSPVDGRIVIPGTTNQGLTSFISVEAGMSLDGALLLEVFDIDGNLLSSVVNGPPPGSHGRTTMTIDRAGISDIGFFRISTSLNDTFGVDQVGIETPIPEPATIALLGLGALSLLRRKK